MAARKIVVVGNGMVGHHYVEQLIASGQELDITVLGAEPRPAYDRVHLSEFFAGKKPEELALTTREHYREQGVKAHFGDPVSVIDRDAKVVTTAGARRFAYDTLVLATGSYPFVPPIPGGARDSCLVYRTIDDLDAIQAQAQQSTVGVVVGGGLLGLECANALKNLGLEAHVVEFAPGLMGVQLDDGGSRMLRRKIEALGVRVHTGKATKEIVDGAGLPLAHELRRRQPPRDRPDRVLRRHPPPRPAGARLRAGGGGARRHRGGLPLPHQRSGHLRDRRVRQLRQLASTGWWHRAIAWRRPPPASSASTSSVFQGADMSTKLKLLGVDVGSHRRCARPRRGQPGVPVLRREGRGLQDAST